ncbi:hypothetical protein MNBD_GAMMA05-1762 [hydrothermal vent metagenome]|uniref:Uncharacterized protein n=1 Tax=hydrothermal vent metagenome TaxID=652676 RepID=A0A3B0WQH9_9ZZZZ
MTTITTETFFLPTEVDRKPWLVPANIYNLYHSLQARNHVGHVFVPIRTMQFMAVLDKNEIVFVDAQSYAVTKNKNGENEGGRLILLAWKFPLSHDRDSLDDPMQCEVVFYDKKNNDLQLRIIAAFKEAMELMDQRYRDKQIPAQGAKVLTL